MSSDTEEAIHHLAMALQMHGAIAKAVAQSGDVLAVADMMIAQRLLRETVKRHDIPCTADLGR